MTWLPFVAGVVVGVIAGFGLAIWGVLTLPRGVVKMFNTPPKGK